LPHVGTASFAQTSSAVRDHKAEDEEAIASTLSGIVVASYSVG